MTVDVGLSCDAEHPVGARTISFSKRRLNLGAGLLTTPPTLNRNGEA